MFQALLNPELPLPKAEPLGLLPVEEFDIMMVDERNVIRFEMELARVMYFLRDSELNCGFVRDFRGIYDGSRGRLHKETRCTTCLALLLLTEFIRCPLSAHSINQFWN